MDKIILRIKSNVVKQEIVTLNDESLSPDDICESWIHKFVFTTEVLDENGEIKIPGLRKPQIGALHAFLADNQNDGVASIIVMPTGTGKTETMLSILIANQCHKLLVLVPSNPLRTQISKSFLSLGMLPKLGLIPQNLVRPKVGIVRSGMAANEWESFIENSNVIITTMSIITTASEDVQKIIKNSFSNIFIDEAHHIEAGTWSHLVSDLNQDYLTLFTATPFRNDGKKLRGKFIYNFTLKEAQKLGYYKPIKLEPIRAYSQKEADEKISQKAIFLLRRDIKDGYDHILMARCKDIKRAEEVFEYYKNEKDLSPILIHKNVKNHAHKIQEVSEGHHKVVVCVNMLGEGYDLPNLKIAALHDPRKSLPVMLQFIGRFTRISNSKRLNNASFVINIADDNMNDALEELYSQDANWNELLPRISDGIIKEEQEERNFMAGFKCLDTDISIDTILPAMSCLIYKVDNIWNPNAYADFFSNSTWSFVKGIINDDRDTLIIVLGKEVAPIWSRNSSVGTMEWEIILIHYHCTQHYNHAYINVSGGGINISALVESIFGNSAKKITGQNLFRVFHNIKRMGVTMFGGRKNVANGNVSFKSFCGKDVEEGISQIEAGKLIRNNITGYGYRDGIRTSVGCTVKGKIWSVQRDSVYNFVKWCRGVGSLIEDERINNEEVLKHALHVRNIEILPESMAIAVDWNDDVWLNPYRIFKLSPIGISEPIDWTEISLEIAEVKDFSHIHFCLSFDTNKAVYEYKIDSNNKNGFIIEQVKGDPVTLIYGHKEPINIVNYFNSIEGVPVFFFANGDVLQGKYLAEVKNSIPKISVDQLIPIDWKDTDLKCESMHLLDNENDLHSIQKFFLDNILIPEEYSIIYDDDGSGEVADLIGIKEGPSIIEVSLFHLKFAIDGKISDKIENLYTVCGQAIRSLKWHNSEYAKKLFSHLIKRANCKKWNGKTGSRIIKGSIEELERLLENVRYRKKLKFYISIVQPSVSKQVLSDKIGLFLGSIDSYMEDVAKIKLTVFCSE